jgi:hypothetical protein
VRGSVRRRVLDGGKSDETRDDGENLKEQKGAVKVTGLVDNVRE